MVKTISPERFEEILNGARPATVLDIRNPNEFDREHVEPENGEIVNIPFSRFTDADDTVLDDVPDADTVYVICWTGVCSERVGAFLANHGVTAVSVEGGMEAWRA